MLKRWWLLRQLAGRDATGRLTALEGLIALGPTARPSRSQLVQILAMMGDENPRVASTAERAVLRIGDDRTGDLLAELAATEQLRGSGAHRCLARLVERGDRETARSAARALASMGQIEALRLIIAEDRPSQLAAAEALAELGEKDAIDKLVEGLSADGDSRQESILRRLRDRQAIPALARQLVHEDYRLHWQAESLLEHIDPRWRLSDEIRDVVPLLTDRISEGPRNAASESWEVLRRIGKHLLPRETISTLLTCLDRLEWKELEPFLDRLDREWATSAEAREAVPELLRLLVYQEQSYSDALRIRTRAARALKVIDPPGWRTSLPGRRWTLSVRARKAMRAAEREFSGWAESPAARKAIPALAVELVEDWPSRSEQVLEKIDRQWTETTEVRRAIPALVAMLGRSLSRLNAERMLARIDRDWMRSETVLSELPNLYEALGDRSPQNRVAVCLALGAIADRSSFETILMASSDSIPEVRAAAADALGKLGMKAALPGLATLLKDPALVVAKAAARSSGLIGDIRAVQPLIGLLESYPPRQYTSGDTVTWHRESELRETVTEALRLIGDIRAVQPLVDLLERCPGKETPGLIQTLGELGDARAVDGLLEVAKSLRNFEERLKLLRALAGFTESRIVRPLLALVPNWLAEQEREYREQEATYEQCGPGDSDQYAYPEHYLGLRSLLLEEAATTLREVAKKQPGLLERELSNSDSAERELLEAALKSLTSGETG